MAGNTESGDGRRGSRWRIGVWGTAAFLLLLPLVAMQFTDEVNWDETDFIVFGAMLLVACGTYELAARRTGNGAYRAAVGVAVAAAFQNNPADPSHSATKNPFRITITWGQFSPLHGPLDLDEARNSN